MNAVDTNILIYARDPRDPVKQLTAISLLRSLSNGVLLWQVACEYMATGRKLEPLGLRRSDLWQDIRDLRRIWAHLFPRWEVLDRADVLMARHALSFWDALIVAACLEGGVRRLYSEDLGHYGQIEGLELINPFAV